MRLWVRHLGAIAIMAAMTWLQAETAIPATLVPAEKAAEVVVLRNVAIKDGKISGELVNQTKHAVRDVQLLIRHLWQWKNEFRPGTDEVGRAVYHTVEKEIAPGGSAPFSYEPSPPLPSGPGGFYQTTVSIAGFTEIIR